MLAFATSPSGDGGVGIGSGGTTNSSWETISRPSSGTHFYCEETPLLTSLARNLSFLSKAFHIVLFIASSAVSAVPTGSERDRVLGRFHHIPVTGKAKVRSLVTEESTELLSRLQYPYICTYTHTPLTTRHVTSSICVLQRNPVHLTGILVLRPGKRAEPRVTAIPSWLRYRGHHRLLSPLSHGRAVNKKSYASASSLHLGHDLNRLL